LLALLPACTESAAAPKAGSEDDTAIESIAETRPDTTTFQDVLAEYQDLNERLDRVAAPLRLSNTALCPRTIRDPGFSTHRLEDYPAPMRPMAEALLGIQDGGLFVRAVRSNTSAEEQRIEPGDQILAVNENPISSDRLMQTYNRAVLRNGFDSVLSKVRVKTSGGQEYIARIRPDTACDIPAKVISSDNINGHTDGQDVLITSALMRSVKDDTNLALVIAHEMAHVIADHEQQAQSQDLELEADRMALVLMARAGFDIEDAVAYWESAAHPHEGGTSNSSSHPTTQARYENFRKELARIKRAKTIDELTFN